MSRGIFLLLVLALCTAANGQSQLTQLRACNDLFERFLKAQEELLINEDERPHVSATPLSGAEHGQWRAHVREWRQQNHAAWQRVIDAGRRYLDSCDDSPKSTQTSVLRGIAEGLEWTGHADEALPILKRCLLISPDDSACLYEVGEVERTFPLCDIQRARDAYNRVIEIGGFPEIGAQDVSLAKSQLSTLDDPVTQSLMYGCSEESKKDLPPKSDEASKRFGTGFYVSKQGHILSNNHVVKGCKTLTTREGKKLTIVDTNSRADLALLRTETLPDSIATFRLGAPPKAGDTVVSYGFPLPSVLSSEGNISVGILSATSGLQDNVRFIQISAPVQPGNSGGPLLDSSGHVIGVVVAKLDALEVARLTGDVPQNVNFAVHWSEVRAFLRQGGCHVPEGSIDKAFSDQRYS